MSILQHTKTKETKGFHYHHIIPKHLGGSDDMDNLVLLSPIDHAKAHLDLFLKYGRNADAWAYNRLMRQIGNNSSPLYCAPNKGKKFSNAVNSKKAKFGLDNAMSRKDVKEKHRIAMNNLRGSNSVKNFGSKNPSSKPILIDGVHFENIANAAKHYNVGRDTIRGWIVGAKPQKRFNVKNIEIIT